MLKERAENEHFLAIGSGELGVDGDGGEGSGWSKGMISQLPWTYFYGITTRSWYVVNFKQTRHLHMKLHIEKQAEPPQKIPEWVPFCIIHVWRGELCLPNGFMLL